MGWDDQMKGNRTIDQNHVHPGDGWRGRDRKIMRGIQTIVKIHVRSGGRKKDETMRDLKTISLVYLLPGDGKWRWDRIIRWKFSKQLIQVHVLPGDEEDEIRWSDEEYSNNWRTSWRQMKRMGSDDQKKVHQTINQVRVLPEDGWGGKDRMIR